ncbi:UPF0389 protein CG9231 [Oratosquilla oratoria]|uniref:UPF0389 protein CG9231 n=1 Tax=Oratosquilla oratoria TaxID=337810 RepID=UPI003F76BA84
MNVLWNIGRHALRNKTMTMNVSERMIGSSFARPYCDNTPKDIEKVTPPSESKFAHSRPIGMTDHKVNKLERYLLVWGGKYKSLDEVPNFVRQDTMERARNKARIKINLMMAAATLFGCGLMIWSGKRAQARGESVAKQNLEWHRKIKEEAEKEAAKKIIS